jgi:hypothetical protein
VASPDSSDSVRQDLTERLDAIEREHDATVLYACESGSRAWGFASADSDYDVRFIYAHPRDWYLSLDLDRRDDTVDRPITEALDLHGWDLHKALRLFRTSNPSLLEWLRSPIVYREDEATMARWRDLLPDYYTPRAAGYAYRNMAQSIAQEHLSGETVSRKAYLYVLRALLAVRWVEQRRDRCRFGSTRWWRRASSRRRCRRPSSSSWPKSGPALRRTPFRPVPQFTHSSMRSSTACRIPTSPMLPRRIPGSP